MRKQWDTTKKLYTLCILTEDTPGILSQVARLFSRKGYNIESIVSGATDRPGTARISIELLADELIINQLATQCRRLLGVQAVKIFDEESCIRREIALIKVKAADHSARDEVIQLSNIFRGHIIDVDREQVDYIDVSPKMQMLEDFGILEIATTGTIAIERGRSTIYDASKLKEEYEYGKNVL